MKYEPTRRVVNLPKGRSRLAHESLRIRRCILLLRTDGAGGFFASSFASRAVLNGGRFNASSTLPVRTLMRVALPDLAVAIRRSASRCHFALC